MFTNFNVPFSALFFFAALYAWLPETEIRKTCLHSLMKQVYATMIDIYENIFNFVVDWAIFFGIIVQFLQH